MCVTFSPWSSLGSPLLRLAEGANSGAELLARSGVSRGRAPALATISSMGVTSLPTALAAGETEGVYVSARPTEGHGDVPHLERQRQPRRDRQPGAACGRL